MIVKLLENNLQRKTSEMFPDGLDVNHHVCDFTEECKAESESERM